MLVFFCLPLESKMLVRWSFFLFLFFCWFFSKENFVLKWSSCNFCSPCPHPQQTRLRPCHALPWLVTRGIFSSLLVHKLFSQPRLGCTLVLSVFTYRSDNLDSLKNSSNVINFHLFILFVLNVLPAQPCNHNLFSNVEKQRKGGGEPHDVLKWHHHRFKKSRWNKSMSSLLPLPHATLCVKSE